MSKRILKSRYYKYPSLRERTELSDGIPKYGKLDFKSINVITSALNGKQSLQKINKINVLNNWSRILSNKLFLLHETHLFLKTHYDRGFKENILDNNQRELADNILFRYFSETFYYFFFSVLDLIAQILNEYFDLNFSVKQIEFNSPLIQKVDNDNIRKRLQEFNATIKDAREKRNSFTHRFPENEMDLRTKISIENGRTTLSAGLGTLTSNYDFITNISESSDLLKKLIANLKLEINKSSTVNKELS